MQYQIERLFKQRFDALYVKLIRYAAWRLPAREATEDVVADTFLEAWKNLARYDATSGDLDGWVFGIARHRITDYWRQRHQEPLTDEAIEERAGTTDELSRRTDELMRFDAIMRSLPDHLRALLTLRHVDGHTHEEIADMVGKSPAAVRQTISRLHRKLRQLFPFYDTDA